jgi:arsenate reductase
MVAAEIAMGGLPRTDAETLLLHNPRCSKSRAARALLEERGVAFRERRYLDEPLTLAELRDLAGRLAAQPRRWVRAGESAYAEAGLTDASSDDTVLRAVAAHPILLERPILVRGGRAVVGRPPERVLELL